MLMMEVGGEGGRRSCDDGGGRRWRWEDDSPVISIFCYNFKNAGKREIFVKYPSMGLLLLKRI